MVSYTVSTTASSLSKESPVTIDYLADIIKKDIVKFTGTNEVIEHLLAKLQKKSSKHKFLIQTTRLNAPDKIDTELNLLSSFGAVWDSGRDGYVSLKIEANNGSKEDAAETHADKTPKESPEDDEAKEDLEEDGKHEKTTQEVNEEKEVIDTSIDTLLISIYWVFVD